MSKSVRNSDNFSAWKFNTEIKLLVVEYAVVNAGLFDLGSRGTAGGSLTASFFFFGPSCSKECEKARPKK